MCGTGNLKTCCHVLKFNNVGYRFLDLRYSHPTRPAGFVMRFLLSSTIGYHLAIDIKEEVILRRMLQLAFEVLGGFIHLFPLLTFRRLYKACLKPSWFLFPGSRRSPGTENLSS